MRTTKQLLKLMRKKLIRCFITDYYCNGICSIKSFLYYEKKISKEEYIFISRYLNDNLPAHDGHVWKPGRILPRYIWLTKQIKKLKD